MVLRTFPRPLPFGCSLLFCLFALLQICALGAEPASAAVPVAAEAAALTVEVTKDGSGVEGRPLSIFSGVSGGSGPVSYQWYRNDYPMTGKTEAKLTFSPLRLIDDAVYYVIASDGTNTARSSNVFVRAYPKGRIAYLPAEVTVTKNSNLSIPRVVKYDPSCIADWLRDGEKLGFGVRTPDSMANVTEADAGEYTFRLASSESGISEAKTKIIVVENQLFPAKKTVPAFGCRYAIKSDKPLRSTPALSDTWLHVETPAAPYYWLLLTVDENKTGKERQATLQVEGVSHVITQAAQTNDSGELYVVGGKLEHLGFRFSAWEGVLSHLETGVKAVELANNTLYYVDRDGRAWGVGNNQNGQLLVPGMEPVRTPIPLLDRVKTLAAAGNRCHLLDEDGVLWTIGDNSDGAAGYFGSLRPVSPSPIADHVVSVSTSTTHTLYLCEDGTLWGMGFNSSEALGPQVQNVNKTPRQIATGILTAAAGEDVTVFVKKDGTAWLLGRNQNNDYSTTSVPEQIVVPETVKAVSAGNGHVLLLTASGALYSRGANRYGQLGLGDMLTRTTPALVTTGVSAVRAGGDMSFFLKTDNTLWYAGVSSGMGFSDVGSLSVATPRAIAARVSAFSLGAMVSQGSAELFRVKQQPQAMKLLSGTSGVLSIEVDGYGPFTYQWYRNGVALAGATGETYQVDKMSFDHQGEYWVVVKGPGVNYSSVPVQLLLSRAPEIHSSRLAVEGAVKRPLLLWVRASGTPAPSFQWRRNGEPLPKATSSYLNIQELSAADAGTYDVVISNEVGSITSPAGEVKVLDLTVSPKSREVGPSTGAHVIQVDGLVDWTATCAQSWVHLPVRRGAGPLLLEVFTEPNTSGVERRAVVKVNDQEHLIIQKGTYDGLSEAWLLGAPTITPRRYSPLWEMGSRVLKVQSNGGMGAVLEDDGRLFRVGTGLAGAASISISPAERSLLAEQVTDFSVSSNLEAWVRKDGTLWVCGTLNGYGIDPAHPWVRPGNLPICVAEKVSRVWICDTHYLFLKTDGSLWAAGSNSYRQTNASDFSTDYLPHRVAVDVQSAAVYDNRSMFLGKNGDLWAMGQSANRVFGLDSTDSVPLTKVASSVKSFSMGTGHSVLVKTDGTLWTTRTDTGEAGAGNGVVEAGWKRIATEVREAVAYGDTTMYLKNDNTVWLVGTLLDNAGSTSVSVKMAVKVDALGEYCNYGFCLLASQDQHLPRMLCPPTDALVDVGEDATFRTIMAGAPEAQYQWTRNGSLVAAVTGNLLSLPKVQADADDLVGVSVLVGSSIFSSNVARVQVLMPPTILMQPCDSVSYTKTAITLKVLASGAPVLRYQWRKDGVPIPYASSPLYSVPASSSAGLQTYDVVVSNSKGSVTSRAAKVSTQVPFLSPAQTIVGPGTLRTKLSVLSKEAWQVEGAPDWIKVQPSQGTEVADVFVYVAANPGDEDRRATLRFGSATYSLLQKGRAAAAPLEAWQIYGHPGDLAPTVIGSGIRKLQDAYAILETGELVLTADYLATRDAGGTYAIPVIASEVVDVATNFANTYYLNAKGELWGWGRNDGSLGNGSTAAQPLPVRLATDVSAIAAGGYHVYFLRKDGSLWGAGPNTQGILGNGKSSGIEMVPIRIADEVRQMALDDSNGVFVKKDGSLWGVGFNLNGQLQQGGALYYRSPLKLLDGVLSAGLANGRLVYLKEDGVLWTIGASFTQAVQIDSGVTDFAQDYNRCLYRKKDGIVRGYFATARGLESINLGLKAEYYSSQYVSCRAGDGTAFFAAGLVGGATEFSAVKGAFLDISPKISFASGATYQWYFGDQLLAGETKDHLLLSAMDESKVGAYSLVVTNPFGVKTTYKLAVRLKGGRILAISVRAKAGADDETLMLGVISSGTGKSPVLMRALGPNLAEHVSTYMRDPSLIVYNQAGARVAANDNWQDGDELRRRFAAAGMIPLPPGSTDAALPLDLEDSVYSMHVAAVDGRSGIALAELYEAGLGSGNRRLTAVSVRNQVGSGNDVLIAGLVISGDAEVQLLVRGIGPALTGAVGNPLKDPVLRIHNAITGELLATNDNWSTAEGVEQAMTKLGFPKLPSDAKDAAYLFRAPPGVYTVTLSGKDDGTGIGLIEIYEVP